MTVPTPPSPPPAGPPAGGSDAHGPVDDSLLDQLSPIEFEALRWSVRMSDGVSAESRAEFEAWLDADPAHRAAYEEVAGVWDAIEEIPAAGNAQIRASVAIDTAARSSADDMARAGPGSGSLPDIPEVSAPVAQVVTPTTPAPAGPVRVSRRRSAQALVITTALGVFAASGWLGWKHWQSQPGFSAHYATQRGGQETVQLPDGSSLQLDTATRADVALYRDRREVRVPEGQVFFHVSADAAKPFEVWAGAARITVVGTRFSVRYTPSLGDQAVQVAVSEGRVRVAAMGGPAGQIEPVTLTTGQMVTADAEGTLGDVTVVAAEAVAPWREQRLSFDGVPLAQVLAEIGRYRDPGVRVLDPAIASLPVTASVDLRRLNAFVLTLPRVLPVRLERRDQGVEIVSSGH